MKKGKLRSTTRHALEVFVRMVLSVVLIVGLCPASALAGGTANTGALGVTSSTYGSGYLRFSADDYCDFTLKVGLQGNYEYQVSTSETPSDSAWQTLDTTQSITAYPFNNIFVRGVANKGTATTYRDRSTIKNRFTISGTSKAVSCTGDVRSLIDSRVGVPDGNGGTYTDMVDNQFECLFSDCEKLSSAPQLPETKLTKKCYKEMFRGCSALISAPKLPATTLSYACYEEMFYKCTSLKDLPALNATTLACRCYVSMFNGCSSILVQRASEATTLGRSWTIPESASVPSDAYGEGTDGLSLVDCSCNMFAGTKSYDGGCEYYNYIYNNGEAGVYGVPSTVVVTEGKDDARPEPIVMYGDTVLKKDVDYELSYSNGIIKTDKWNSDPSGRGQVTVTGKGDFAGTVTKTYNEFLKTSKTGYMPDYSLPKLKTGLNYNGSPQELVDAGTVSYGSDWANKHSGVTGEFLYSLSGESGTWSKTIPTATKPGTYTVYAKLAKYYNGATYSDFCEFGAIGTVTIAKATPDYVAPTADKGEYSWNPLEPRTTFKSEGSVSDGQGTIEYLVSRENEVAKWSTTASKVSEPGTYTSYFRIVGNDNYADVNPVLAGVTTVSACDINDSSIICSVEDLSCTGDAKVPKHALSYNGATLDESNYIFKIYADQACTQELETVTAEGTYYAKFAGLSPNLCGSKVVSFNVIARDKEEQTYYPPILLTTAYRLVYYGIPVKLLSYAGYSYNDCEFSYSIDKGANWSTEVPVVNEPGTYDVYYKISGNEYFKEVGSQYLGSVTVTEGRVTPTYTAPEVITGLVYNGKAQELITAGSIDSSQGTMFYRIGEEGTWSTDVPTATNIGSYTVYYQVEGTYGYKDIAPQKLETVTISEKTNSVAPTYTKPTLKGTLTYDGKAQALCNAGSVTSGQGTMKYSTDSKNWSTSVPTATNAGTYTVYYKVDGANGYGNIDSQKLGSVTINKATPSYTKPTLKAGLTPTGSAQPLAAAGSVASGQGTMQYSLDGTNWSTNVPTGKDLGTYTVYYKIVGNANYNDVASTKLGTVAITEIPTGVNVKIQSAINTNFIVECAGYNPGVNTNIQLYTSDGGMDQMWRFEKLSNGNYVIRNAKNPFYVLDLHGGVAGYGKNISTWGYHGGNAQQWKLGVNADGTYTFYSAVNKNYALDVYGGVATWSRNIQLWYSNGSAAQKFKIQPTWYTAPTTKSNLTYNGTAQALVNAGSISSSGGGTMYYSTDNKTWSASVPTAKDAGSYDVYYKIEGDSIHGDVAATKFGTVTIAKTAPSYTAPTLKAGLTPTGSAQALATAGSVASGQGTMQYSLDGTNWSTNVPTGKDLGTYTVYYKIVGNANYNDVASTKLGTVAITEIPTGVDVRIQSAINPSFIIDCAGYNPSWNTNVNLYTSDSGMDQIWRFEKLSNGNYVIRNAKNSYFVLDVHGGAAWNGTNVSTWGYNGGNAQQWKLGVNADGTYTFYSAINKNYALDVSGGVATWWRNIQIWSSNGSSAQKFKIQPTWYAAPTTKSGLTYDGTAQALVNAGSISSSGGGTMYYSTDNKTWSTDVPKATNAGTYSLYYKIEGDSIHGDVAATKFGTVTIAKKDVSYTAPTLKAGLTPTGSAQALATAGSVASGQGTMQYSLDGTNWSTSLPTAKDLGTYTVYYKIVGTANYSDVASTKLGTVTIAEIPTGVDVMIQSAINPNFILEAAGNNLYNGPYIQLNTSDGKIHQFWRFEKLSNGNYIIRSAADTLSMDTSTCTVSSGMKIKLSWYSGFALSWLESQWKLGINDDGTYTFYNAQNQKVALDVCGGVAEPKRNIQVYTSNGTAAQKFKIQPTWYTAPTTKTDLTYNGSAQSLVNAGSISSGGGTMYYSTDAKTWSTDVPKATNAGTYTLYYKIEGNSTYGDVAATKLGTVTIAKKAVSYTAPTLKSGLTYNGSAQALATADSVASGQGTMYYSTDGSSWSTRVPTATTAGTYTVYYKISGSSNYTDVPITKLGTVVVSSVITTGVNVKIQSAINSNYIIECSGYNPGKGVNAQLWTSDGGMDQQWVFEKLSNGNYVIRNAKNKNYVLDVNTGSPCNNRNIYTWAYHGGTNQQWKAVVNSDGTVTFLSAANTKYALDACGGVTNLGTNIQTYSFNSSNAQRWRIIPQ